MRANARQPTPRQAEVLAAIRGHILSHGVAPSIRELCSALGISSTGAVSHHLTALEKCGLIVRKRGARQIHVLGSCPYCGK